MRSIVGRYLEHSRIYCFANGAGPGEPAYYIGSADLMPRNLDRRVEALVPVDGPGARRRGSARSSTSNLADDELAWTRSTPTASWRQDRPARIRTWRSSAQVASRNSSPRNGARRPTCTCDEGVVTVTASSSAR